MAEELERAEGEAEAPKDDLRSIIEAAVEEQKSDAPDQEEAPREARPADGGERARDPATGRFVEQEKPQERAQEKPQAEGQQRQPREAQQPREQRLQDGAGLRPPDGWTPANKAQWTRLPMPIREAIAGRENQIAQAEQRFASLAGVERYADNARRSGTTLERALEAYTGIEDLFRRDPAGGLIELLRNTPVAAPTVLREVIRRLSGPGAPQGGSQPQPHMAGPEPQIHPAVLAFMNESREREMRAARTHADSNVREFWADPKHPYAENVASTMADLIHQAHARGEPTPPLEQVYETACWMSPEVRALLIEESRSPAGQSRQREVARQARSAAKATTGAPANGAEYRDRPPDNATLRETIEWSLAQQR